MDCPYEAAVVDIHVLVGTGSVWLLPGSLCVSEEAQGRDPFESITVALGSFLWFGQLKPCGQVGVISGQL